MFCIHSSKLPVVTYEDLFEKINECHTAVGHLGRDKTWHEIKHRFSFVPLNTVKIFIGLCDQCVSRKVFPKPVTGKPIVSVGFMTRMQIDLVDMRSVEHNGFKWIFHAKDHFSKYSWLYPLTSKEAINVAEVLKSIFYQFGPPRILQSDNGREFVAKVILDLTKLWLGLLIINGRPRHPQSQGLVERGNAVVQQLLGKWLDTNVTTDWPSGLGPVMYAVNTSVARTINQTPFQVVFGQQPRTDDYTWKCIEAHLKNKKQDEENYIMLEEDLPVDIFDMTQQADDIEGSPIDQPTKDLNEDDIEGSPIDQPTKDLNEDDIEGSLIDQPTKDSNEDRICTDATAGTGDQSTQNNEEEIRSDLCIDHEELVDGTIFVSNDVEPKPESIAVNRHKRIRENAEECYLNNAHAQLTRYMSKSSKRQRTYHVGDVVGLKITDVDRTDTSPTILPCKIVDSKDQDGETLYNVATMNGIIKESFQSAVFLDLTASNFTALRILNTEFLLSISFIQACQTYTSFKSANTCKCNGDCSTNRCQCKKKDRMCCSKCHGGNGLKCKNC
ncbi:unnamed protein product [Rotaria magnacalcarata]|uniref:Integrase catalytic domain-containing protein n=4 Tax=Rotaria magnacalcarata TaxID=392030 RepID=A0A820NH31_9BILA|nr:unnamed protein product [Rotaria magnacalcarata]